ncbi:MAG: TetR/AcrR family transcriptional regulator [Nitriliruptorales bacterium]|nr:TetR/AcrR family transcriptional regulator [Nitriliruptorales bacterium]
MTEPRDPHAEPSTRAPGAQGQATRRRLLDAGRDAMNERGYHATRVDDVVRRAGTSHGTFYLYFESKEGMLEALREDADTALDELTDALPPIVEGDDGRAEFRRWIDAFADFSDQYGAVVRANLVSGPNGSANRPNVEVFDGLQQRLAEAIEEAGCEVAAAAAAMAIIAMVERFSFLSPELRGDDERRNQALDTLATFAHAGLFA